MEGFSFNETLDSISGERLSQTADEWPGAEASDAAVVELLESARQGSDEALGEVLNSCRNYLLLVANQGMNTSLRAKVGASDIVQETLFQAQVIFGRFHGTTNDELLRWLGSILRNKLFQEHRKYLGTTKRKVSQEVPMGFRDQEASADQLSAVVGTPSEIIHQAEEQQALQRALATLSKEHHLAIMLRSLERKSFAEIGATLGRTPEAARKLWLRAIQQLQTRLR